MAELKNELGLGQIQIADEVIAIISGTAATEVEGVIGMSGNFKGSFSEMLGRKNLSKGVKIEINGNNIIISLNILVKFGSKIQDVSKNVQKRVKAAVETMTGLNVTDVNVTVCGVYAEKEAE